MKNEESRGHSTPFSMIALISNRLRSSTKTNNKNRLIDLNKKQNPATFCLQGTQLTGKSIQSGSYGNQYS